MAVQREKIGGGRKPWGEWVVVWMAPRPQQTRRTSGAKSPACFARRAA
jgi:hypothetical protein